MLLHKKYKEFNLVITNDELYSFRSTGNATNYNHVYINEEDKAYSNLSQRSIQLIKNGKVQTNAIVLCSGGGTGIHEQCCVLDNDTLLICCGDSVFCLELPLLRLQWQTKVDMATCFEIVKHADGYIVHGELEISRLNNAGEIVWSLGGPDIFVTLDGSSAFKVANDIVYATVWIGITFEVNAYTGQIINA